MTPDTIPTKRTVRTIIAILTPGHMVTLIYIDTFITELTIVARMVIDTVFGMFDTVAIITSIVIIRMKNHVAIFACSSLMNIRTILVETINTELSMWDFSAHF